MGTPIRTCVACRRAGPKETFVRLAVVDGVVVVDRRALQPGRGAYLCPRPECLTRGLRRNAAALRRGFRSAQVKIHEASLRSALTPQPAERDDQAATRAKMQHPTSGGDDETALPSRGVCT